MEYLLTRLKAHRAKPDYENFALEHVLSYQRCIAATKHQFMRRGKMTPLGVLADWWDRYSIDPSYPSENIWNSTTKNNHCIS